MTAEDVEHLSLMGISGIANMLCAIKFAKYYELSSKEVVAIVLTDSVEMYMSRLEELHEAEGEYTTTCAAVNYTSGIQNAGTDNLLELTYSERKRVHNLKYYTWVEQQGKCADELHNQWYHQEKTFEAVQKQAEQVDELICEFNEAVGLVKS